MTALAVAGIAGEVDLRTARIKVTDPAFSMAQKPQKTMVWA